MAKSRARADARKNRRGSREAVEKRRAARAFNDALTESSGLDGRTEKRRRRLLEELGRGVRRASGEELKPVEVLLRVNELLDLGESLATIRKACPPKKPAPTTPRLTELVRNLHQAYEFRASTYRFVGVGDDLLRAAGVLGERRPRRRKDDAKATLRRPSDDG